MPYTAQDYLAELIDYGGEQWPRGRVIADMQAKGFSQSEIDCWMMGQNLAKSLAKAEKG
jgi:hypothetical protein